MTVPGVGEAEEQTQDRGLARSPIVGNQGSSQFATWRAADSFSVPDDVPEIVHGIDSSFPSCDPAWPHGDMNSVIAFDLWLPFVPVGEQRKKSTSIWTDGINDSSIGGASLGVRRQGTQWIMRICAGNTSLLLHDLPLEAVAAFAGIACAEGELHDAIDAEGSVRHAVVVEITARPGRIRLWVNGQLEREGNTFGSTELLYGKRGRHANSSSCTPDPGEQCRKALRLRDDDALQSFLSQAHLGWRHIVLGGLKTVVNGFKYEFTGGEMSHAKVSSIRQYVGLNLGQCQGRATLHGSWAAPRSRHNKRLVTCHVAHLAPIRLHAAGQQRRVMRQERRSGETKAFNGVGDEGDGSNKLRYHPTPSELMSCLDNDPAKCRYLEQEASQDVCMLRFGSSPNSVVDAARCSDPYFGGSSRCCYHPLTGYCLTCRRFESSAAIQSANALDNGQHPNSRTRPVLSKMQPPVLTYIFSKVFNIVTLPSQYSRALTFENFEQ
jgi:hypothetical protein